MYAPSLCCVTHFLGKMTSFVCGCFAKSTCTRIPTGLEKLPNDFFTTEIRFFFSYYKEKSTEASTVGYWYRGQVLAEQHPTLFITYV